MSDKRPADPKEPPRKTTSDTHTIDEIPVEELLRLTRAFTERITNRDRQRLALELKDTGHQPTIQSQAPVTLQQFFSGEIDLDTELAKRFSSAPLLSQLTLNPKTTEKALPRRNVSALMLSQDNAAMLSVDIRSNKLMEATFTVSSMLSLRFELGSIEENEKKRWIELMRRKSGIAFLWSKERWEKDYMIFVVREYFARVYAFSSNRFDAAVRITPDVLNRLLDWLEVFWVKKTTASHPGVEKGAQPAPESTETLPQRPTLPVKPDSEEDTASPDSDDKSDAASSTFEW